MTPSPRPAITILGRATEPGRVKTRLARDLGPDAAAGLHEALALDVIESLAERARPGPGLVLALTGAAAAIAAFGEAACSVVPTLEVEEQADGDLGARIEACFSRREAEGRSPSLVIGTDALLDAALLDAAGEALAAHAAVLVPARDGGFALLGARHLARGTLGGIRWGSEHVAAETLASLRGAGLAVAAIGEADDVDDVAGLRRLADRLRARPRAAPRTSSWLRSRGFLDA